MVLKLLLSCLVLVAVGCTREVESWSLLTPLECDGDPAVAIPVYEHVTSVRFEDIEFAVSQRHPEKTREQIAAVLLCAEEGARGKRTHAGERLLTVRNVPQPLDARPGLVGIPLRDVQVRAVKHR
jgi:hypothetical protein